MGSKKSKLGFELKNNDQVRITTYRGNSYILKSCEDSNYKAVVFYICKKENLYIFKNFDLQLDLILVDQTVDANPVMLINDILISAIKNIKYWPKDMALVTDSQDGHFILENLKNCNWPGLIILIDPKEKKIKEDNKVIVYRSLEEKNHINLRLKLDIYHNLKFM